MPRPKARPASSFPSRRGDFYPIDDPLTSVPLGSKLPIVQSTNDRCFALSPLVTKVSVIVPRPAEADHGRDERRCQGRGPAAADLPQRRRRRREERPARAVRLEFWRTAGSSPSTRRPSSTDRHDRPSSEPWCCSTPSSRRPAKCPSSLGPALRASCFTRPSVTDGGRFQPEEDLDLQHHDRQKGRRAFRLYHRRRHHPEPHSARSTSTTRARRAGRPSSWMRESVTS